MKKLLFGFLGLALIGCALLVSTSASADGVPDPPPCRPGSAACK